MIIEMKEDVVRLSGSLTKNMWMNIKAAANVALKDYPQGIVVDCAALETITGDGAKTFLEAMRDIEAAKARIIVANLPQQVFAVCKSIPGVRSQLPIADSVEEARASLRMAARTAAAASNGGPKRGAVLLVPLLSELDLTYGAHLAGRLARDGKSEVRLVYFMEVARNLPLGAPLLEEEQAAQEALRRATQYTKQLNVPAVEQIEKVRDATEGILNAVKTLQADAVVVGAGSEPQQGDKRHDMFHNLVDTLLHRAPCEVIIGRLKGPSS